jgi:hypothetical protein
MPKRSHAKPAEQKQHRWRVSRIRGTPAILLGHVYAVDETSALRKAVKQFQMRPELVDRLVCSAKQLKPQARPMAQYAAEDASVDRGH